MILFVGECDVVVVFVSDVLYVWIDGDVISLQEVLLNVLYNVLLYGYVDDIVVLVVIQGNVD